MKTKSLSLVLCLVMAYACSEEQVVNKKNIDAFQKENVSDNLLIDKKSRCINQFEAQKMALLFQKKQANNSSRNAINWNMNDVSVKTLSDDNNTPLLHIVNMGNNNGYVIISATKNAHPIVAFSEKGSFNTEEESGSVTFINQYKEEIKESYQEENSEIYTAEWALFEKGHEETESRATPAEIEGMIQTEINQKTALGYTYIGKLSALPYYLPQNEYEAVIRDISSHTNPAYDYEEVSLFFIKSYDFQKIDKLISTKWHQHEPFNIDAPNGKAGCVTIAAAQIAYYHKYPTDYNWNQIYKNPIANTAFNTFIKDVRHKCNIMDDHNDSDANYNEAYNGFKKLGYNVTKQEPSGAEYLRNEIIAYRPIAMFGWNDNRDVGHTWICEGYLNKKYQAVISMIDAGGDGNPYFDYPISVNPINDEMYGEFFYMNFGANGTNDGWYRANAYVPQDIEHSYISDQKLLLVRKP